MQTPRAGVSPETFARTMLSSALSPSVGTTAFPPIYDPYSNPSRWNPSQRANTNNNNNKRSALQMWSIALIAAAVALLPLFLLAVLLFFRYSRRQRRAQRLQKEAAGEGFAGWVEKAVYHSENTEDPERVVELQFFNKEMIVFDLDDLLRASAEVISEKGKLGTTYKTMLESGFVVAVKRLEDMNGLRKKEFIQQMELLGNMRHENLSQLISFYYSKEEKLVIHEFVPHGNLFQLLHENRRARRVPLRWYARLSIIKGIAKGLAFLHQSLPSHHRALLHANLKSSNVLIQCTGENYMSKLTDFGFLPFLHCRKSLEKLAIAKSPEFSQGKKLTQKADVYCFGIIVLEIITGRIPGQLLSGNNVPIFEDLCDWVRMVVNNDWTTDVLDEEIRATNQGHEEMLKLTEMALQCTDMTPEKRPKMSEVARRIEEIGQ
ncbi:leucine-rich repeat receptor-like protein kinase PXC1 [Malania oleifera]|uniref:leucine-rich repeat receptor-like protein kinase PXC1 n=1 Tax=Malania oleifera TaxID=397392 RepID=UPI0025AEAC45|nr:leucine-rich repeat receptor-like protein kinase PXC1 [Malania oleifera]